MSLEPKTERRPRASSISEAPDQTAASRHYVRDPNWTPTRTPYDVPFVRTIQLGKPLLLNGAFNKGLAWTKEERVSLRLQGLLPAQIMTQDEQITRCQLIVSRLPDALSKYTYLQGLEQRNTRLFYRLLQEDIKAYLPLVYTPTVGAACQAFSWQYRSSQGIYITPEDRGNVFNVLQNWPAKTVRSLVITDGERILGLGDLGACGMGIPIGKSQLYTACAGIPPRYLLPVCLDVGTDNEELLNDPLYIGRRTKRLRGQEYDDLVEEFIQAVQSRFGPYTLIQFEDFGNRNAKRLLDEYEDRACTFNDDIQGTSAVVVAGFYAAERITGTKVHEHRVLIIGAGEAGIGTAELLTTAICEDAGLSEEEARKHIFLVDSRGLITKDRPSGGLNEHKMPFAHEHEHLDNSDLAAIVASVRPTAIVGVSAQPGIFTQAVCEKMAELSEKPIIFPLSNPTSKAECTAEQAYTWTQGKCVFASGSPFDPVTLEDGSTHTPGQANNAYIFPGLALGILATASRRVTPKMFMVAAKALAQLVDDDMIAQGNLYPPLEDIMAVSAHIAAAVGEEVYEAGLATMMPKPAEMLTHVREWQWHPGYSLYAASAYM